MDSPSPSPSSLTFLKEAQESFEQILNERKSILRPEIKLNTVKEALERLLCRWKGFKVETLEPREYESVLEAQKIVLNISLIYKVLVDQDLTNVLTNQDLTNVLTDQDLTNVLTDQDLTNQVLTDQVDLIPQTQNSTTEDESIIHDHVVGENDEIIINNTTDISLIILELERLIDSLDKGSSNDSEDMIKSITRERRLKLQIILLAFLCQSQSRTGQVSINFEDTVITFSREDILAAFTKILPKPFNYNFYMKYYASFLQNFVLSLKDGKLRHLIISVLGGFCKQFPQFPLSFEERHDIVMKRLGMESFNLEDCCDRIETRAAVMSFESPIEMAQKMFHLWLLIDTSEFLTFDDNFMAIYVFSSDLPVYHEQIMRIFYVLNRIDEVVREIGYSAYSTPQFISYYTTVYTEMHTLFSKLIRALTKNYEIYEIQSDPISGAIKRKTEASAFMPLKLKELAIYLTCPMACLDSILRLSLEVLDIPILFGDEEEKFVFTTQPQSNLVLHDFVASDRENFAEHMVELYPCLDRHFSRFHKSKKMESQGPNTSLPPSYHLFASKPPTYDNINESSTDLDLEMQANDAVVGEDCCSYFCKKVFPALIFSTILILTVIFYIKG
jgi:hypothetical protein